MQPMSKETFRVFFSINFGHRYIVYFLIFVLVASQVIAMRTLRHKNLLSVASKIVIQLNCKLGGSPWFVPVPFRVCNFTSVKLIIYCCVYFTVLLVLVDLNLYIKLITSHTDFS